ncbi:MAG: metallophosphoesterase [Solirubrobacterales bacterium]|nr:metallophosphoesterase [Solirubrobacterales bacterium]
MHSIRTKIVALSVAVLALAVVTVAQAAGGGTFGKSTLTQRIEPDGKPGFNFLGVTGAGENYTVRDGSEDGGVALGQVKANRDKRRTSISYFGQLTDFQLADEESPARVEFTDPMGGAYTSAWRPQEALAPFEADQMMRQFNYFSTRPPTAAGNGAKPKMDFVVNTGDVSDNDQYNETLWNLQIMDGDTVSPGSGVDPASSLGTNPLCPASLAASLNGMNPAEYAGVQDRDLWPTSSKPGYETDPAMGYFWDPDDPNPTAANPAWVNPYADAPDYPGLMNRAQKPFKATGLKVPGYIVFGNHDNLVQGNVYANKIYNQTAVGCLKPIDDDAANSGRDNGPLLSFVLNPNFTANDMNSLYQSQPKLFMPVPPDPDRRLISRKEYMKIFESGKDRKTGHGFGLVDRSEAQASNGYAGYYSFSPRPGVRYIVLDTTAAAGKFRTSPLASSSEGNIDDPQFKWFESKLKLAKKQNEVAIVFSHHAIPNLDVELPDETAPSCKHVNITEVPGCDGDPRFSGPIHLGADAEALMLKYPNAIAWVAGHSHENKITPYPSADGKSGFWSIRTAALADWPKQNRLLELFDNRDGTLSLFGTLVDHAAPAETPAPGTSAAAFTPEQLASIGREIGFNDSQVGGRACGGPCGEGQARDRNAELLIKDPRRPQTIINSVRLTPKKRTLKAGRKMKLTVSVSNFTTATAVAKRVRVALKSSNRQLKVKRVAVIGKIAPGKTGRVKVVVRATRKAKGKAKITAKVAGKKATATVTIKPVKKKHRKRR